MLAVGLATGKVPLYSTESGEIVQARCVAVPPLLLQSSGMHVCGLTATVWGLGRSWTDISARVTALAFSSSGKHLAASSLDESVRVYSVEKPSSILSLKNLCVPFPSFFSSPVPRD